VLKVVVEEIWDEVVRRAADAYVRALLVENYLRL